MVPVPIKIETNHPCRGAAPNLSIIINMIIASLNDGLIPYKDKNKNSIEPHLWTKKYFSPISKEDDILIQIRGKNESIFSSMATHITNDEFDVTPNTILIINNI